ncbi:uncharacterized protein [Miscanthus floridulus]|uniref:uncharacterized protein n=1 Tax=Miscanthus floridulus TaxID=154761 RepID=UPI003459B7DE
MLHQVDLSTATLTQILGKINAHEKYMHITSQNGSSSTKKKDLAFKASQEKKGKAKVKEVALDSSSDDEHDDVNIALMEKKTTKMLKKLNKNSVKFDSKKKFFTISKRKPIFEMDFYNYGELGHLAHQCPKPKKEKYKKKNKDNKDDSSDDEKRNDKLYKKKDGKKKQYHKKKNSKAYIVGDWLMNIDSSSGSSRDDSDDEKVKVAALVIETSLPPPPPPPSSSTHLCPMAKGERKIDISTSCDDLIVESIEQGSSSQGKQVVVAESYDDYVKIKSENGKLKKDLEKLSTNNSIVID